MRKKERIAATHSLFLRYYYHFSKKINKFTNHFSKTTIVKIMDKCVYLVNKCVWQGVFISGRDVF